MKLEAILKEFRDRYEITCPESIYQRDKIAENALPLIEALIDVIGYYKEPMTVLICGGRDFGRIKDGSDPDDVLRAKNEVVFFYETMGRILDENEDRDITIVQGGAKGADHLGKRYAEHQGLKMEEYKADWDRYGKRAGIIRNEEMLTEAAPDLVVAFKGGRGTAHMVKISKASGIETLETWEE